MALFTLRTGVPGSSRKSRSTDDPLRTRPIRSRHSISNSWQPLLECRRVIDRLLDTSGREEAHPRIEPHVCFARIRAARRIGTQPGHRCRLPRALPESARWAAALARTGPSFSVSGESAHGPFAHCHPQMDGWSPNPACTIAACTTVGSMSELQNSARSSRSLGTSSSGGGT